MPALEIIALDTTTPQLRAPSAADTYTAPRAMDITPVALTGSSATSSLSIAQTWNTTGTPTAIDLNVTDTASNASSLLMNLRVGGTTQFRVAKNARTTAATWESDVGYFSGFSSVAGAMARTLTQRNLIMDCAGSAGTGVYLPSYAGYYFTASAAGADVGVTSDLALRRDAANTLAQRNGVNAQVFNIYNTFTDASNYQRIRISSSTIFTENAGTGAAQSLSLGGTAIGARMVLNPDGAIQFYGASVANIWNFSTAGHLLAASDNTRDIGASGANRPRDIYTAGKIDIGNGNLTLSNDVRLSRRASGVLLLDNNGGTDFGRLQFGGTTSSFPALKRNGTTLETKLADDSGFAPHAAEWLSVTDGVTAPGAAAGRARIYVDSADGDLKVVFADGTVKTIVTDT